MKKCPFCAEEIEHEATVCEHCGRVRWDAPLFDTPKRRQILGRDQLLAGITLIHLSGLASWNQQERRFAGFEEGAGFEQRAKHVNKRFGRVACWIWFCAGVEYLTKGVFLLKPQVLPDARRKRVREAPAPSTNGTALVEWAKSGATETVLDLGTLGKMADGVKRLLDKQPHAETYNAAFDYFRQSVRNRDAHWYAVDVREARFYTVDRLFVPMLNALLKSLPEPELEQVEPDIGPGQQSQLPS